MNGFKFIRNNIINKTMEEVATELNVSKQTIHKWEKGVQKIPEKRLSQLADIYDIPKTFFSITELSERDIIEIKRFYFQKKFDESIVEYKTDIQDSMGNHKTVIATHYDKELSNHLEFIRLEEETQNMFEKINALIHTYNGDSYSNTIGHMQLKKDLFDKFADIVTDNEEILFLNKILRALELFFNKEYKKNPWMINSNLDISDSLANESTLVQQLFTVLTSYKNEEIHKNADTVNTLSELGLIDVH